MRSKQAMSLLTNLQDRIRHFIYMDTTQANKLDKSLLVTPTGTQLNCKGWVQEAALRMLFNNLDPDVAERPEDLIVYGGRGKAARDVN